MLAPPPLPTLLDEKGPPPPLGYRPNIALFSRIDTCRGFSYTVFHDCVYIHAHTHTRHTPDAVRFISRPRRAPNSIRPACVRTCVYCIYTATRWGSLPIRCCRDSACVWGAISDRGIRAGLCGVRRVPVLMGAGGKGLENLKRG